jgi:protein SCO1/2
VCPDELTKISKALALLDKRVGSERVSTSLVPIFVSVDPERDSPDAMNDFLSNEGFDRRFIGLTGSIEQCAAAAKAFRVYYMKTDESESDYLVDHSIITYLMGPDGSLLDYFGKNVSAEDMASRIERQLQRMEATTT